MKISDKKLETMGLKGLLPFISCVILIFIMIQSYKVQNISNLMPFLTLIAVYQWAVYVPRAMPQIAVFAIGLLQDILSGGPLGMVALLLVIVRLIVYGQGRKLLERDFLFNWLVFLFIAFGYAFVNWVIILFYYDQWQMPWMVIGQAVITVVFFPLIFILFSFIRKVLHVSA